jgi:hypothetical protein
MDIRTQIARSLELWHKFQGGVKYFCNLFVETLICHSSSSSLHAKNAHPTHQQWRLTVLATPKVSINDLF